MQYSAKFLTPQGSSCDTGLHPPLGYGRFNEQLSCIKIVSREARMAANNNKRRDFDPDKFLATIGEGRKILSFRKKQTIFAQGDSADAVFFIQQGKAKLSVVSK